MNRFELIEKLRERADINYEEADQLLSDTQDDLIAALIILEKQGRLKGMQQGRPGRTSGTDDVRTEAGTKKSKRSVIGHAFRTFGNFIAHTTFHMAHGENEILVLPTFVFALLMLFFWQTIAPLMLISLFFKVHYFFDGTASTKAANDFIDQAEELATDFDFMPARTKNRRLSLIRYQAVKPAHIRDRKMRLPIHRLHRSMKHIRPMIRRSRMSPIRSFDPRRKNRAV